MKVMKINVDSVIVVKFDVKSRIVTNDISKHTLLTYAVIIYGWKNQHWERAQHLYGILE